MAYLIATNPTHCAQYLSVPVAYIEMPEANVLAVLDGGNYLLAKVSPPQRQVACYLHSRGDIIEASVQQLFTLIQEEGIAWCEL